MPGRASTRAEERRSARRGARRGTAGSTAASWLPRPATMQAQTVVTLCKSVTNATVMIAR